VNAATRLPSVGAFRTVRARLLFWTIVVVTPIYAAALYLSFQATAQRLEQDAIGAADELAARLAMGLDAVIRPIEGGIRTVAYQLEEVDAPPSQYLQHIRGILSAWPDVYGSTIAIDVDDGADARPFAPYLFRVDDEIRYSDLATDDYAYRELPWYRAAADGGTAVWSAPYFDTGGGETWMVTYSVPYFRKHPGGARTLAGVVTADLDLEWLRRTAAAVSLGPMGIGWLSPADTASDFIAPIGDTPARINRFDSHIDASAVRAAGEAMLASGSTFGSWPRPAGAEPAYLAVRNLSTLGWHLTLVLPRDELLAQARQLLQRQIALGLLGLAVLVVAVSLVAAGIARPIRRLAMAVGGDLRFELPEAPRRDELGVLTAALRRLRDSLQEHVQLRAASLAAEAQLENELEVSARIQQSMLPHGDSLRALPAALEISVVLQPARHVGGDLYDYFPLHDGRVLFVVGDVSDKGIPAALFMARLSALLRVLGAAGGHSPDRLLAEINDRLVEGNDTCMFVTAGCGLLDPKTGRFRYASAGHDPPLLRTVEGAVQPVTVENGPAIGIEPTAHYPLREGVVAPGDALVLFTDGVTEAEAADGSQFGIERLVALLGESTDGNPAALIARIVAQVASHAADHHASDDLTLMAIRFSPADVLPHVVPDGAGWLIDVESSPTGLERAQRRLRGILQARDIEPVLRHNAELIAEEWLSNVVRAGAATSRQLSMDVALTRSQIALTFRDDGDAFDPLEAATPDLDADIAERPIGGLGLHLVRELATACQYTRIDGCNVLLVRLDRNT